MIKQNKIAAAITLTIAFASMSAIAAPPRTRPIKDRPPMEQGRVIAPTEVATPPAAPPATSAPAEGRTTPDKSAADVASPTNEGGGKSIDTPPEAPPATDRGIKDNGVKQCGKCGVTSGRVKAPSRNLLLPALGALTAIGVVVVATEGSPTSP